VERTSPNEHALGVLKRVRADVADDPKRLGRLKHEIETVRDLKHPFIAELLDFNFNELWFVTRYAALGSLGAHLAWFKGDVWRTLRMARDLATALGVAHGKGVIHRDIKPANILLHDPNHVALTDFGIAHDDDQTEVTSTLERVGAQWFRPPEAEHGRHEPVPAFDVYMLGKVIYVALSGGERFRREAFQNGAADLVTMFARPELVLVNTLLAKMIVEEPTQRFQTMGEVIGGIDTVLARLSGQRFAEAEHRLLFMFGDTGSQRYSGDHPGLQLIPVWMPATTRLVVDLRIHPGAKDAHFAIEFWSDETKVIDSGRLQSGRHEVAVPAGTGGRWMSLRIGKDHGWGTANISNLVVHALCGE
jgi:serine/threonine protein kinase